jgi:hypothetical protein
MTLCLCLWLFYVCTCLILGVYSCRTHAGKAGICREVPQHVDTNNVQGKLMGRHVPLDASR